MLDQLNCNQLLALSNIIHRIGWINLMLFSSSLLYLYSILSCFLRIKVFMRNIKYLYYFSGVSFEYLNDSSWVEHLNSRLHKKQLAREVKNCFQCGAHIRRNPICTPFLDASLICTRKITSQKKMFVSVEFEVCVCWRKEGRKVEPKASYRRQRNSFTVAKGK